MKFIHTADLHIDQPFSGIDTKEEGLLRQLRDGNEQLLTNIIDTCLEEDVDFLLLVGDTFHQHNPSIHTQHLIMTQLERLNKADIPVVLSFGNHDYYTKNRYWFDWPTNVHVFFDQQVETKTLSLNNGETVAISGFSYTESWIKESKLSDFPSVNQATTYHIGCYHGELQGKGNYAPFSLTDMPSGYDYWALGHIHKSQIISEKPFVVYPGTPQGHHKKEHQVQGVAIVTITSGQSQVKFKEVSAIKWHQRELTLVDKMTKQQLLNEIESDLLSLTDSQPLTVVTMTLTLKDPEFTSYFLGDKSTLLAFIQRHIFAVSKERIWLADIKVRLVSSEGFLMGFDESLVDDLSRKYEEVGEFQRIAKELTQQPGIGAHLSWDAEDIKGLLATSNQLIKDHVIFHKEDTYEHP